jgi:hypothetical protein
MSLEQVESFCSFERWKFVTGFGCTIKDKTGNFWVATHAVARFEEPPAGNGPFTSFVKFICSVCAILADGTFK